MEEGAATVVRRKPDASVRVAARLVREGRACAVFTCGNTGAAMAASLLELGPLGGVKRPAVAVPLPRVDGRTFLLLDAGANVDCDADQLVAFARMGAAWAGAAHGLEAPRVGVLSNGSESSKGNQLVRATLEKLQVLEADFELVGPVEPTDAFAGCCDVLVCDGFVGNVLLKTVEGVSATVVGMVREEIARSRTSELGAWLASGATRRLRDRVAWEARGGALLLGVDGVVTIGHGRAESDAVGAGVLLARKAAEDGVIEALRQRLG